MSKKPVRPGEIAANAKDISINRSSYNVVESNPDTSDFTLFDCVLRPSFVNNYSNFSKNPSEYLIYNSENGALLANYNYEINICSKNSMFFQLSDSGISYVDVYQPIENTVISSGTGLYISIFSDWAIQVNSDYNTQLSAITDWSDKYIKLLNRNLYIKVKGYNSSTYTLSTEFSVSGVLSDPADVGATNGIILLVSKTKDLTATFWKNIPTNAISTTKKQLSSINVDNNSSSITINDDTDWSDYSDWTTAIMCISCGGTYVGSYNLTTGVYSHLASASTGDLLINFSFTQGAGAIDGDYITLDNLYITFYNGETIYLNGIKIQAEDSISKTLYIDEHLNIYDNSGLTQIKTINSLEENCSYINKAFYDYTNYITLATTEDIVYLFDKYAYTKTNILVKDSNSRTLQLSNYTNIDDDAVLDDILTKEVPDINDYTAFGATTSDFAFYDVLTYEPTLTIDLDSTTITYFLVDTTTTYDDKEYYAKFIPTGHIWKFTNSSTTASRQLTNEKLMEILIPLKDLGGDTFLMRESDGTTMSLSEAIKGKMIRRFKIEIDQDWNTIGENLPFEIKNNGNQIFSVDKTGSIAASGNFNIAGDIISDNVTITNNLGVSGGLYVENTVEIKNNLNVSGDIFVQDNISCSGSVYDKEQNEIYGGIFDRLAAVAGTYYNNDNEKIYARNINGVYNCINNSNIIISQIQTLSEPRGGIAGFELNNYGYVVGGTRNGGSDSRIVEKYNILNNSYTIKNSIVYPTKMSTSHSLNGFGYLIGGFDDVGGTNVVEKYNQDTDTWAIFNTLNITVYGLSGFSINNFIYTFGGLNVATFTNTKITERYDGISNIWINVDQLNTDRKYLSGFSINGYGYSAGGDSGTYSAVVERYNIYNNTWTNISSIITARSFLHGSKINGFGYTIGGNTGTASSTIEKYNDIISQWTTATALTTAKYAVGGFSIHDNGYICGGYNSGGAEVAVTEKINAIIKEYYVGPLFSTSKPISKLFASSSFQVSNIIHLNRYDSLENMQFQYRTSPSGAWCDGYINDLDVNISGNINSLNDKYDYEFKILIPERCNINLYENVWVTLNPMLNQYTFYGGSFAINGYGYLAGGEGWQSKTRKYNDTLDSMISINSGPATKYNSCFDINGYAYSIGNDPVTDVTKKFNQGLETWITAAGALSEVKGYTCAISNGNYGYVFGGLTTSDVKVDTIEKYDSVADSWAAVVDTLSANRSNSSTFLLSDYYGYIVGGNEGSAVTTVEKYNFITDTASAGTALLSAKYMSASFEINGDGYACSGGSGVTNSQKYINIISAWMSIMELGLARLGAFYFNLNNYGYVFGGYGTTTISSSAEKYSDGSNFSKLTGFAVKFVE